jgi:hypothetical protein
VEWAEYTAREAEVRNANTILSVGKTKDGRSTFWRREFFFVSAGNSATIAQ